MNKDRTSSRQKDDVAHQSGVAEKRWWQLTRFEWIMSVLTLAAILVAVFTGLIFLKQLKQMRTDQRAWMRFTIGKPSLPKDAASASTFQISTPVTINNIGKTAARMVYSEFVMDYEEYGASPDFIYGTTTRTFDFAGIMFPDDPFEVNVPFVKAKSNNSIETEPRYLTPSQYEDLSQGKAYLVLYGRSRFVDIFGTKHWSRFCAFLPARNTNPPNQHNACAQYNDTDHD
jgi:hypothetical protein